MGTQVPTPPFPNLFGCFISVCGSTRGFVRLSSGLVLAKVATHHEPVSALEI